MYVINRIMAYACSNSLLVKICQCFKRDKFSIWGHPFMMATRRGGVRFRWTPADMYESAPCGRPPRKLEPIDVILSSSKKMVALDQNFLFGRTKKWKFFISKNY